MSAWEQIIAAGGVILLVMALRLAARPATGGGWWQRGVRANGSLLEAVDQLRLTPQHSIHAVRFSGKTLLVAVHSGGIVLLDSQSSPVPGPMTPETQLSERTHR